MQKTCRERSFSLPLASSLICVFPYSLFGPKMTLDLKNQDQDQDEKFYAGSSSLYWVHVQVFIGDLFKLLRRNGV